MRPLRKTYAHFAVNNFAVKIMNPEFLKYQAQTSPYPLGMEVSHAIGSYIYDANNKKYLDFVAGVSACSLGHQHPKVNQAI